MIKRLTMSIPNEKDSELEACEHLETFAKKLGYSPEAIDEIRLAVIEAIINGKEHAKAGQDVQMAISADPDNLSIQVRDFGQGFNPSLVEKPDIKKKIKSTYKRGWGLMLMEKLMDGMEVTSFPPTGTLITMVKKRPMVQQTVEANDLVRERKNLERLKYVLGSLIDLSSFLCAKQDLETGLRSLLRILLGTLGISRGAIYVFDQARKHAVRLAVDIKLKAMEKVPFIQLDANGFSKLMGAENVEVSAMVRELCPPFDQAFKTDEVQTVFLLRLESEFQGLLVLGPRFRTEEGQPFDHDLLGTLSRNISTAINTFKLMHQLKVTNTELDSKIRELDAIHRASQEISAVLELENLAPTIERIFKNVLPIDAFSLALYDPSEDRFNLYCGDRQLPPVLDVWDSPISRHVIQKMEALHVKALTDETRFTYVREGQYKSKSFMVIPVVIQDEVLGLISLTDRRDGNPFSEQDFNMARLLSVQVGIAIKNANLYRQGITDGLTRLYTHAYFKMRLAQEIARLRRVVSPLSVIMVDLDHFKSFNDRHGHQVGDLILARSAKLVRQHLRFNDIPCRYGGEEFAVILPDTDLEGAVMVAERMRRVIESHTVAHKDVELKITASFGVAQYIAEQNLEQVIGAADSHLYQAKSRGRNTVCHPDIPPKAEEPATP